MPDEKMPRTRAARKTTSDEARRAAWRAVRTALSRAADLAHENGAPDEAAEAFLLAANAIDASERLSDPNATAAERGRELRNVRAAMTPFSDVMAAAPSERAGRLRAMKLALHEASQLAPPPLAVTFGPDELHALIARDERGRAVWTRDLRVEVFRLTFEDTVSASIRHVPEELIFDAIDVEVRGVRGKERHAKQHALAKALRCGTTDDEGFRTDFARVKL